MIDQAMKYFWIPMGYCICVAGLLWAVIGAYSFIKKDINPDSNMIWYLTHKIEGCKKVCTIYKSVGFDISTDDGKCRCIFQTKQKPKLVCRGI